MNIKNTDFFTGSFWDWSHLNECFKKADGTQTKIKVMDIDGLVERNGCFLLIETKHIKNFDKGFKNTGQFYALNALSKIGVCVFIVWGTPPFNPEKIAYIHKGVYYPPKNCTDKGLKKVVNQWFLRADSREI